MGRKSSLGKTPIGKASIGSLIAVSAAALLGACSSSAQTSVISVSASFYPIAEIVRTVGGNEIDVQDLTPIGHDAHDTELTAKQLQRLEKSSIIFYFGDDFQPGSQKAIESQSSQKIVDLFEPSTVNGKELVVPRISIDSTCQGCESGKELDPHVWLNPSHMITLTQIVQERLSQLAPQKRDFFVSRATTYMNQLSELGELIDSSFQRCESTILATEHNSFGYFTSRAKLSPLPLAGYSPDQSVSGKELTSLTALLKKSNVSTVFDEPSLASDLVKQVANSIGAQVDSLNAVESITDEQLSAGESYISIMKDNIQKMKKALRCS